MRKMEVFCKSGKWGVVFVKKWKIGGVLYKVDLSSTPGALCTVSAFFILHFTYLGGAYAPNAPPLPTRPADVYSNQLSYLVDPFRKTTPNSSYSLAADAAAEV